MKRKLIAHLLTVIFCLSMLIVPNAPATARADTFTITAQVTAGQGRIDTVGSLTDVIVGDSKHRQTRPAEGWMIEDVQLDYAQLFETSCADVGYTPAFTNGAFPTAEDETSAFRPSRKMLFLPGWFAPPD
ncbi:hypothetical protein GC175_26750 [bacterium]|nr:hypothetical protein [bacterium]